MNKLHTVNGKIDPNEVGMILPHEHCMIDLSQHPEMLLKAGLLTPDLFEKPLFNQKITLENRSDVSYNLVLCKDNLLNDEIDAVIEDLKKYKKCSGDLLVEVTPHGSQKRDPEVLKMVSKQSGVKIIMGSGRYEQAYITEKDKKATVVEECSRILNEFEHGVEETGVKPGTIGEIGISDPKNHVEYVSLMGAIKAQKEIGCSLYIHPPIFEDKHKEVFKLVEESKIDLNKVIWCHTGDFFDNPEYYSSLAKKGCYIATDTFGSSEFGVADQGPGAAFWLRSDKERVSAVREQVRLGNLERILISNDVAWKICFSKWGGYGYAHIPKHILPRLKAAGLEDEQIDLIISENPKRVLAF